ncbi:MAG TPA: hypothetical protein VMD98_07985, partial [Bryocella sp.]|nr:hypothetical protein [Bryocella sp.]
SALAQQQTLARLSSESRTDDSRPLSAETRSARSSLPLHDSALSRAAATALFVKSDLTRARALADSALRHDPQDAEALFVRMESAKLETDYATTLDAAVRLCEVGAYAPGDTRVRLAAVRVREAAANTPEFRRVIPRLQTLLTNSPEEWPDLQLALLNAAMDGAPGLNPYALGRAAGILTDWRIAGPLGAHLALPLEQSPISQADDLVQNSYAGRAVENFAFPDGWLRLPDYLPHRGVFYAAARFAVLTSEVRHIGIESSGLLEVFVDGQRVLHTDAAHKRDAKALEVTPGPHRVLVKFMAQAAPLRIIVSPDMQPTRAPLRARLSLQEATYLLAAEHYSDGEFTATAKQIEAEAVSARSSPLAMLHQQALSLAAGSPRRVAAWRQLRSPSTVTEAIEPAVWAQRLAEHPSCENWSGALAFDRARGLAAEADTAEKSLDGCAPESLAYAQSLSRDGRHADAAQALRRLLAAAPLNREALLMLVRELQLAGDDAAAELAAADWLRVAPNAPSYHRLAASASLGDAQLPGAGRDFYAPYRRDAALLARKVTSQPSAATVLVLEDQVAIARPDGSVSLYVHTARRFAQPTVEAANLAVIPSDAQVLTLRIVHRDGTFTVINGQPAGPGKTLSPGDTIDAEYVVHFAGDGGIPEHAEAFQFIFGSFDEPVLNARFVVLTPADHGDGGVVIATGRPPAMTVKARSGMLERVWQKSATEDTSVALAAQGNGMAIVRVVEEEHGWSVPSDAEHKRRIETIHPGPWPVDS